MRRQSPARGNALQENTRRGLRAFFCAALLLLLALPAASRPRSGPASQLPDASRASEYWDLLARFESGHLLLARYAITNEGPGDHTAYLIGHIVFPDGHTVQFEKGKKEGKWSLSADGLHIAIGDNVLDQHDPVRHLRVDRRSIIVDLDFTPRNALGLPTDPSEVSGSDNSYWIDLLHSSAPVEGSLFVPGMEGPLHVRGRISATHTWMSESETDLTLRRIEFFSLSQGAGGADGDDGFHLHVSDLTTPGGSRSRWLVVERSGEVVHRTRRFEIDFEGRLDAGLGRRYPVPAKLVIRGPELEGEIQLASVLATDNPMKIIPQPFRFLLSFKMKPRRAWVESPFEIRLRGQSGEWTTRLEGTGITNVMFVNPLPRSIAAEMD